MHLNVRLHRFSCLKYAFLLIACLLSLYAHAERHFVVEIQAMGPERSTEYVPTLLKMILNASKAPDEVIDFNFSDHQFSQARWIAEVQRQGSVNHVLWTITTKDREDSLRPIRIPIFKGLMGTRVLIIRKEDKEIFSRVTNKKELSLLRAGQGVQWPDTDILKDNDLPVTEGVDPKALYQMLKAKRFDYFPRGIFELSYESEIIKSHDLLVDNTLLLSYPMPMYFFVNKYNTEFAERIEKGFDIILKNGEFNKLFFSYPPVVEAIKELKKHKRHVIRLDNSFLPKETPLDRPELWFDVSPYQE